MFKTLKTAWGIPEIRKKILFTLFIIAVFRLGCVLTVPFLNTDIVTSRKSGSGRLRCRTLRRLGFC